MTTSWALSVIGECVASHEVIANLARQADAAYLPIIAKLVEACANVQVSRDAGDLYDDYVTQGVDEALALISPADRAVIEAFAKGMK